MYFGEVVGGDYHIIRINKNGLLSIATKESTLRLPGKGCPRLECGDSAAYCHCPARAYLTGVLPGQLRMRRYNANFKRNNMQEGILLHNKEENEESVPVYWKCHSWNYFIAEKQCHGREIANTRLVQNNMTKMDQERLFVGKCKHGLTESKKNPGYWSCATHKVDDCRYFVKTAIGNDGRRYVTTIESTKRKAEQKSKEQQPTDAKQLKMEDFWPQQQQ